ncbi:MAG: pyridoxamine 5'-phosphate oxidase family protein, partial [Niameybacter sp.]
MKFMNVFKRLMEQQGELALATCKEGIPNVRIVNFCYDEANEGIVYFATFGDNPKIEEFAQNNKVAFTTIPHVGNEHVRVKNATILQSQLTV